MNATGGSSIRWRGTKMQLFAKFGFWMLIPVLGFIGCGGSPAGAPTTNAPTPKLAGIWQGKMVVNPAAAEKLPADKVAALQQMKMEMTFQDNGSLLLRGETNGQPYSSENRWKLISATNSKVTIESTDAGGNSKPIDLLFDNADAFHMPLQTEVADLGSMQFQRLR
jgi:hypothetical protein